MSVQSSSIPGEQAPGGRANLTQAMVQHLRADSVQDATPRHARHLAHPMGAPLRPQAWAAMKAWPPSGSAPLGQARHGALQTPAMLGERAGTPIKQAKGLVWGFLRPALLLHWLPCVLLYLLLGPCMLLDRTPGRLTQWGWMPWGSTRGILCNTCNAQAAIH